MTTMDKAAIGWSIGIVIIGVAIAFAGQAGQELGIDIQAPKVTPTQQEAKETIVDPFADIAAKVKENPKEVIKDTAEEIERKVAETVKEPATKIGESVKEQTEKMAPGPQTVKVAIPTGTSVPGCEETNECYIPESVTIFAGDTVAWTNEDAAAHTVTAGTPTDVQSGVFDSSLIMGGAEFEHTFNDAGNYDYFCMIHPWMVGNVQVN